jgi:PTS system glucitol/sorbitol-specific IIA component
LKYHSVITEIGAEALNFLTDESVPFIILFADTVPPELAEVAVLHHADSVFSAPAAGDTVLIGEKVFEITAVGDSVAKTLQELGHCTLCFQGSEEPERPGCIMLDGEEMVTPDDVKAGTVLEIH